MTGFKNMRETNVRQSLKTKPLFSVILLLLNMLCCSVYSSQTWSAENPNEQGSDKQGLNKPNQTERKTVIANVTPTAAKILWLGETVTAPLSLTYEKKQMAGLSSTVKETSQAIKANPQLNLMNQIQLSQLSSQVPYLVNLSLENINGHTNQSIEINLPPAKIIKERKKHYFQSLFKVAINTDIDAESVIDNPITENTIAILNIPSKSQYPLVGGFSENDLANQPVHWFDLNNLYGVLEQNIKLQAGDKIWHGVLSPNSCDANVNIMIDEIIVDEIAMAEDRNENSLAYFNNQLQTKNICTTQVNHCTAIDIYMGRLSSENLEKILAVSCG